MSLSLRLNVANAYARNLKMSAAAEKRGLDKTPEFEEEMRYARMQLLAQDLTRALQVEANNITRADLEDYYKKNESSYEQGTVARIFVPHAKQLAEAEDGQDKIFEEAMTKLAADLRVRAVKGEDPDKLQIEAYAATGIMRTSSNTKMNVRRTTLPLQHETVMNLKAGEVSEVYSDPGGAHFIYKMISKNTLTLEEAEAEIRKEISSQRYHESIKEFQGDVVFNDAYFVPPEKPAQPPERSRKRKSRTPPAPMNESHD
ncbi:MAG: hypothetical protein WAL56_20765 [Candidatus Sulfotelmatobacter sp.]